MSYNPNVPSYSAEYQLSNEDDNVKQLRKNMISLQKAPKLILKGDGDLKGSSIGHKHVELSFVRNKKKASTFQIVWNLIQVR